MEKKTYCVYQVSRGNCIGHYSDYIPAARFDNIEAAKIWGNENYPEDGFSIWYVDENDQVINVDI